MTNLPYSRLSTLAVISAVSGSSASLGLLIPELAFVATVGTATGIVAIRAIRKYELCGTRFAVVGLITSVLFAMLTPFWHAALFSSESLPEYSRLDFELLTRPNTPMLDQFVGERICLKGYAVEPTSFSPTDRFVISPNGNTGRPDATVIVELSHGQIWQWRAEGLAVSGRLIPNPKATTDDALPKFMLTHATVRSSRTRYGLANRVAGNGC
jgi:hypothetical protein